MSVSERAMGPSVPRIGILAIQGDVEAHAGALERAGADPVFVRRPAELDGLDGLILPGGESTTIARGIARLGLFEPLRRFATSGRPVLGTCAGAILLARQVENGAVPTLSALSVAATRNAYGTQLDSFRQRSDPGGPPAFADLPCVFIRAPRLRELSPAVEVLARVDGEPVLVQEGAILAATFHPELTTDDRVHGHLIQRAITTNAGVSCPTGQRSKSP